MGSAKHDYMHQIERGWFSVGDKCVCHSCFSDDELSAFVLEHAVSGRCDYCGADAEQPIAAPIDTVMELIARSIYFEWTDPAEELGYESAEGGYQGEVIDTYELFWTIEFPTDNEELMDDVSRSLALESWCSRNPYSPPEAEALFYNWEDFCQEVKHHTRYLSFPESAADSFYPNLAYREILTRVGAIMFDLGLMREIEQETLIFRGRIHDSGQFLTSALELGSPPLQHAKYSNRMSPAGIPMFYGAFDEETVIAEIFDPSEGSGKIMTIAPFRPARNLHVIDFTNLPKIPSLFSDRLRHLRGGVGFLKEFVKDLSKPIRKDGYEHIEYVPSQIVTEYLRHRFIGPTSDHPDGILYPSSQREGGVSTVMFATNEQCADQVDSLDSTNKPLLVLVESLIQRIELDNRVCDAPA